MRRTRHGGRSRWPKPRSTSWPALALLAILAGCATAYHRGSLHETGYTDLQLAKNLYQVRFRGAMLTPYAQVADFALLRSAELTLENGYHYFLLVRSSDQTQPYGTGEVGRPHTLVHAYTVKMFESEPMGSEADFQDAEIVRRHLRAEYGLD